MTVMIALLRGVNVGGNNLIKMDALRTLCESLDLRGPQTYVQSGNVVFQTALRNPDLVGKRIEDAIEGKLGFRPSVMLRTAAEMKAVVARNPFGTRPDIEPAKLLVTFLAAAPAGEVRGEILKLKAGSEEVRCDGRELYVYFPDGMGRSKLPPLLEKILKRDKTLKSAGTSRNWNTVLKLLEMAEKLES